MKRLVKWYSHPNSRSGEEQSHRLLISHQGCFSESNSDAHHLGSVSMNNDEDHYATESCSGDVEESLSNCFFDWQSITEQGTP